MDEVKLAVVLVMGLVIGGLIASVAGALTAAVFVDEAANSLLYRAENMQIDCGQEYNPKALTLTVNGENTYCIVNELKEDDFNAYKPF